MKGSIWGFILTKTHVYKDTTTFKIFGLLKYVLLLCWFKTSVVASAMALKKPEVEKPLTKLLLKYMVPFFTSHFGKTMIIQRMKITLFDKRLPIKIIRKQYPVSVLFVMTINKSQGPSISNVGLYLPRQVFTHWVKSEIGLKVVNCYVDGNISKSTTNVVYKEVLQCQWLIFNMYVQLYKWHVLYLFKLCIYFYQHPFSLTFFLVVHEMNMDYSGVWRWPHTFALQVYLIGGEDDTCMFVILTY